MTAFEEILNRKKTLVDELSALEVRLCDVRTRRDPTLRARLTKEKQHLQRQLSDTKTELSAAHNRMRDEARKDWYDEHDPVSLISALRQEVLELIGENGLRVGEETRFLLEDANAFVLNAMVGRRT